MDGFDLPGATGRAVKQAPQIGADGATRAGTDVETSVALGSLDRRLRDCLYRSSREAS